MQVCTITAVSGLGRARVMARSLAEHHPGATVRLLVLDGDAPDEPFDVVTPADLDLPGFHRWAALEDGPAALAARVRPFLLRAELERSGAGDAVVWLDPTAWVLGPLDALTVTGAGGVALVPCLLEPPALDRVPAAQRGIPPDGFDSGALAVARGEAATTLLGWWCAAADEGAPFRLDGAAAAIPAARSIRDPGHMVAHWNLDRRPLTEGPDGIAAAGAPLRTFNLRGFDPARPHWLSDDSAAVRVSADPLLARLCASYAEALAEAGHVQASAHGYGFERMPGGLRLDAGLRRLLAEAAAAGEDPGDVFAPEGARRFTEWLRAPAPASEGASGVVPRHLLAVYDRREDLRRAFPDLEGADGVRLVRWAREFGVREEPPVAALLDDAPAVVGSNGSKAKTATTMRTRDLAGNGASASGDQVHLEPVAPPGVTVFGHLDDGLALGEGARRYANALRDAGVPVLTRALVPPGSARSGAFGRNPDRTLVGRGAIVAEPVDPVVDLVCLNPPELLALMRDGRPRPRAGRRIGVWAWELEELPTGWSEAAALLDEIWVASAFQAAALAPLVSAPVVRVPIPVESVPEPGPPPDLGLPPGFTFLSCPDLRSTLERKNPLGLIEAFGRAFSPGEGPRLLIKTFNGDQCPEELEAVRLAALGHPDVHVVDAYLEPAERDALLASCGCYVSLHRAEGFGLCLAEAMALGRPVVATGWSGNLDFMTAANSYLVDHGFSEVPAGVPIYPAGALWAEPDLDHAAALMRSVVENPQTAAERGERARHDVAGRLSPAAVGTLARTRVELVTNGGSRPRPVVSPLLSIIVSGTHAWPKAAPCLNALAPQLRSARAELIYADSHGGGLPADAAERYPGIVHLVEPGASVFELRALGIGRSRAGLIATTEDHCIPAPDWCERIVAAHTEHPEALAIGGAVENGSTAKLMDWANYLTTFGAFARPVRREPNRCPVAANLSYKRAVLESADPRPGWIDFELNPRLHFARQSLVDNRIGVHHVQSHGFTGTLASFFHNGRSTGGIPAEARPWRERAAMLRPRLGRALGVFRESVHAMRGKRRLRRRVVLALPLMLLLACCHAAGEIAGVLLGPGRSPERLE